MHSVTDRQTTYDRIMLCSKQYDRLKSVDDFMPVMTMLAGATFRLVGT